MKPNKKILKILTELDDEGISYVLLQLGPKVGKLEYKVQSYYYIKELYDCMAISAFLHKVFCEIVESQETKKRPPYRFPKKIESNKLKSNKKVGNLMVLLDEYANNKESYIVLLFSNNAAKYFYYIKDKLTSHIMLEAIDLIQEKITKESMDGVDDAEEVKENNTDMLQEFLHNLNLSDGDEITFVKESVGGEGEEDDNGDFYEVTNEEVIDLEPLSPKDNDQEIVDEEDEKNFKNF